MIRRLLSTKNRVPLGIAAAGSVVVALSMLVFALGAASPAKERSERSLAGMRQVSYYPSAASWNRMWEAYDEQAINTDFQRVAALGFNTVRIFVEPSTIGYPTPDPTMAGRVRRVVELADAHHLKVALALFDRFVDYDDSTGSKTWLREILSPYRNDPRIEYVELRNEIEPGDPNALRWARGLMDQAFDVAGSAPVVLSVPGSVGVAGLQQLARGMQDHQPSAYGLHYYGQPAYLRSALERALQVTSPVPVFLGEVGYATNAENEAVQGVPHATWAQEGRQELLIRGAFAATRALGMPPAAIWTLNDFDPAGVPDDMVRAKSRADTFAYGLLRRDGSEKPAAGVVRRYFADNVLDNDLNLGFERYGDAAGHLLPLYWRVFRDDLGEIAVDTTTGHSGSASARMANTHGEGADAVPALSIDPANLQVVPGQVYAASAWVRLADATGGNRIGISWFDDQERFLDQKESPWLPTGTHDWAQLQFEATAPAGAVAMKVYLKSSNNSGTVWFDDVEVG